MNIAMIITSLLVLNRDVRGSVDDRADMSFPLTYAEKVARLNLTHKITLTEKLREMWTSLNAVDSFDKNFVATIKQRTSLEREIKTEIHDIECMENALFKEAGDRGDYKTITLFLTHAMQIKAAELTRYQRDLMDYYHAPNPYVRTEPHFNQCANVPNHEALAYVIVQAVAQEKTEILQILLQQYPQITVCARLSSSFFFSLFDDQNSVDGGLSVEKRNQVEIINGFLRLLLGEEDNLSSYKYINSTLIERRKNWYHNLQAAHKES